MTTEAGKFAGRSVVVGVLAAAMASALTPTAAAQYRERRVERTASRDYGDGRGSSEHVRAYGRNDTPYPAYGQSPRGYGLGFDGPRGDPRGFAPPVYPKRRPWSRGQVLPPDYRGAVVADPARYHLRVAPSGYGWVGDGRDAYLMQRSTGMVLDSVPRAYEPAPRRPRR